MDLDKQWSEYNNFRNILLISSLTVVVIIVYLVRLNPYLINCPLWSDEVGWVRRAINIYDSGKIFTLRSPFYLFVNSAIAKYASEPFWESKIRILSIIPGLLWPIIYGKLIQRIFGNKSRVLILSVILLACSNILIVKFTHEAKPYMLALLLHTIWFYSILFESNRNYIFSTIFLAISTFFDYSLFIVYPVHFILGFIFLQKAKISKECFFLSNLFLFIIGSSFCIIYLSFMNIRENYWGNKYNVFYMGNDFWSFMKWFLSRISGLLTFTLNMTNYIRDNIWIGLLAVFSLILTVPKYYKDKKFLIPFTVLIVFSALGIIHKWPFGFFRTNLFMYLYISILLIFCIPNKFRTFTILFLAVLAMGFSIKDQFWLKNGSHNDIKKNITRICEEVSSDDIIAVGSNSRNPFFSYLKRYKKIPNHNCNKIEKNMIKKFTSYKKLKNILNSSFEKEDYRGKVWLIMTNSTYMGNIDNLPSELPISYKLEVLNKQGHEIFATINKK